MTLVKARFTPQDENGKLLPDDAVEVLFNPTEYTAAKTAQFAEHAVPGLDAPLVQYVRGQAETFTMDLFFDTSDSGEPVTERTDRIYRLVKAHGNRHAPPVCLFTWGGRGFPGSGLDREIGSQRRSGFTCVVESVQQRFTFFAEDGAPLRAVLTVRLREYRTLAELLPKMDRQSADRTRYHAVRERETLSAIAADRYGDPAAWRRIAEANGITDPARLAAGTLLLIPPAP
ncbi:peptidoglycan-binding protein [Actinoplanes ianthinogenes]|uniref:Peptidoglycan-binding protein n=1 Tax=Actinoplanes ianthinogenes TaxID=122358 RepID=A0ABM7LKR6_9ACTN|nr:LysM peptidoglycan-binding domain-containing protein [Actinoplanes ianthinogenes]BCJ39850.1 peptidoglycan-binding protein [Actinoplanes ianthinogenes]GGR08572.1 peptidoglycan-binding protein [Actinoplanes ianthinogenes]